MAKLLVQESNGAREFELVDLEVQIGRELDNALRLADPSISRHHAVVRKTTTGYEVQDLGSSNGVLINGVKVEGGALNNGDRITLGQMQLTFVDPQPDSQNPLGTVRMNLEDMAKIQAGGTPAPPPPEVTVSGHAAPPPMPPPAPLPPPPPMNLPVGTNSSANPAPPFLQPYLPPVPDTAQPLLAGGSIERGDFGTRFLALLIDWAILFILDVILSVGFMVLASISPTLGFLLTPIIPLIGICYLVFQLWCMVTFRATIGKKIMKLRVVPEANPTGNIDWGMAVLRMLGHIVNSMLLCLPYLLILGTERKGFQDIFSNSIVIKVDR
jgi:uncharacterized RDD family membrane protein YckC